MSIFRSTTLQQSDNITIQQYTTNVDPITVPILYNKCRYFVVQYSNNMIIYNNPTLYGKCRSDNSLDTLQQMSIFRSTTLQQPDKTTTRHYTTNVDPITVPILYNKCRYIVVQHSNNLIIQQPNSITNVDPIIKSDNPIIKA